MWCYINKNEFNDFLMHYPELYDFQEDIRLYEYNDYIFLPRLFYTNYKHNKLKLHKGNEPFKYIKINIPHNIVLRNKQKPIINHVMNLYKQQKYVNGIIKAVPGIGKTVMSIYLACELGLKTAIVVDTDDLLQQWKQEIIDKTVLNEDDIGIIKGKKIETDKPFVIMSVQTLYRRVENDLHNFYNNIIKPAQFGMVFFDEVHTASSTKKYAKASLLFQTPNIIGLSATPYHTGIQQILMFNTVGGIIYSTKEYDIKPTYYILKYDSKISTYTKEFRKAFFMDNFVFKKSVYDKAVIKSKEYFNVILNSVKKLREDKHTIIIICMTIEQVKLISQYLENNGYSNRRYYGKEREIDKENDDILVVTYKFCGKGFNFKRLSALIFATPLFGKKSLIQTTGRILRQLEGKDKTCVIDLYDEHMIKLFGNRMFETKKAIMFNEFNCEIKTFKLKV